MTVTVRVTCLNSLGLPNLQMFIQGHNTKFWAKCPECGRLPPILRAGRYERDGAGVMQRTSDCRP
jgi:hypothetical protein